VGEFSIVLCAGKRFEKRNSRQRTVRGMLRISPTGFWDLHSCQTSTDRREYNQDGLSRRFPSFSFSTRKGGNFSLIRLVNLQLPKTVIGFGSHTSIRYIMGAQHSGQLCKIRVKMCLPFGSFTKRPPRRFFFGVRDILFLPCYGNNPLMQSIIDHP
jgi:hypothetical protein